MYMENISLERVMLTPYIPMGTLSKNDDDDGEIVKETEKIDEPQETVMERIGMALVYLMLALPTIIGLVLLIIF